ALHRAEQPEPVTDVAERHAERRRHVSDHAECQRLDLLLVHGDLLVRAHCAVTNRRGSRGASAMPHPASEVGGDFDGAPAVGVELCPSAEDVSRARFLKEARMRIAIIEAGHVGQTLGRRWAERGHTIVYGVREPEAPKSKDAATATGHGARVATAREAAADAEVVVDLATSIGFEAIDAGRLRIARLLEPLAMLWIHLALFRGMGTGIAFRLLRR